MVKNLPAVQETWVQPLDQVDPLEKEMAAHSRILPGGFLGQGNLAGYSPWYCKESEATECLTFFSLFLQVTILIVNELGR